jgi:predicted RNA-binding protein with RPS1 domain
LAFFFVAFFFFFAAMVRMVEGSKVVLSVRANADACEAPHKKTHCENLRCMRNRNAMKKSEIRFLKWKYESMIKHADAVVQRKDACEAMHDANAFLMRFATAVAH